MKSLFPTQTNDLIAASVLLSNTYSSVGEHQQAEEVRANRLRQYGKRVKVGRSWTEVDDELVVNRSWRDMNVQESAALFDAGVQSAWPFASAIVWDLYCAGSHVVSTERTWPPVRLQLDHPSPSRGRKYRSGVVRAQREARHRLQLPEASRCNVHSSDEESSRVWRLS